MQSTIPGAEDLYGGRQLVTSGNEGGNWNPVNFQNPPSLDVAIDCRGSEEQQCL